MKPSAQTLSTTTIARANPTLKVAIVRSLVPTVLTTTLVKRTAQKVVISMDINTTVPAWKDIPTPTARRIPI